MNTVASSDDTPVLGNMTPEQIAAKLREMGDSRTADTIEEAVEEGATSEAAFGGGRS